MHFNAQTNKNDVYINTELSTFGSTDISDYDYQCSTAITEGYKKKLVYNAAFDILPPIDEAFGGSTTTYWCDYNWTNNSTTDRLTLIGCDTGGGASSGLLGVHSHSVLGLASADIGTRLIYIP